MEGESEKVQGDEHRGKIDFPVPEVVFEMVAVVLQDVEAFVVVGRRNFTSGLSQNCA